MKKSLSNLHVNIYLGVPGAGKTTVAAKLAKRDIRRKIPVWSNVPIKGTYKIDAREELGKYQIEAGRLIIDEAGIDFNNREFKTMPKQVREWLKLHRHYGMKVDVFSQADDEDITFRRLAYNFYIVKPSIIPFIIVLKAVKRYIGVNPDTHKIEDLYEELPWYCTQRMFAPTVWNMFNTYEAPQLQIKEWEKW
jgi:hypothetical protein